MKLYMQERWQQGISLSKSETTDTQSSTNTGNGKTAVKVEVFRKCHPNLVQCVMNVDGR